MFSTTGRSARSLCFVRLERPSSRDRPWAICCESEFLLLQEGESANLFHLHSIFGTVLQPGLAIDQKFQPSPEAFQGVHGYLAVGIDGAGLGSTQISQESHHRVQVWQW